MGKGLAARLLKLLQKELRGIEGVSYSREPLRAGGDAGVEGDVAASVILAPGAKARIETVEKLARTLEKLLELQRAEAQAQPQDKAADVRRTNRLRDELMRRLRAIDERRAGGGSLFGAAAPATSW